MCYKRTMRGLRGWIDEKMRKRSRRGPNESESTGKSGQELPRNQPAPLRPAYPDAPAPKLAAAEAAPQDAVQSSAPQPKPERQQPPPEKKVEVETQPESLATPPAEPKSVSPKEPRGYVVLTIGLPGSGKTT